MLKQVFSLGVTKQVSLGVIKQVSHAVIKQVFSLRMTKCVFSFGVIKQVFSLSLSLFTDAVLWLANNDCLVFNFLFTF